MDIKNKKAITYSLLAHIKTSKKLSEGPLDIFVPLVKKVLHHINKHHNQYKGQSISEIKKAADELYALDIPIPVLRSILRKIASEINRDEKVFELFNDDAFWLKDYVFEDFDEHIEKSAKEIHFLQIMFKRFCKANHIDYNQNSCIIKFIEKNKINISSYLANTQLPNGEDFTIAASFVKYFRDVPAIYSQIRSLYLGAMLTSYLNFIPNEKVNMNVTLLFDTNFIISLLDLNTSESTHTCNKLLEVCGRLGYTFRILHDTIDEIKSLLHYKSSNFEEEVITRFINKEDIYNACERKKLSSVDLDRISDNLEDTLLHKNIITIPNTDKIRNKAKLSKEYEYLKTYRNTYKAALHDAMALIYVKEKRGNRKVKNIEDVQCWFVNNAISHYDNESVDILITEQRSQPETIKADDLLNIIWLSNPNIDLENDELIDMGVTSLVAYTLNASLPKARIIKELDENIQKYKNDDFSDKDVLLLATRITTRQIKDISSLNEVAKSNPKEFADRIKEEAIKQDLIEKERAQSLDKLFNQLSKQIHLLDKKSKEVDIKIENADRIASKKIEENLEQSDETINLLIKENINIENEHREKNRVKYIRREVFKWRLKGWLFFIFFTMFIGFVFYAILTKCIKIDLGTFINAVISLLCGFIFNSFFLNIYKSRHLDQNNINTYKKSLFIPTEYREIKITSDEIQKRKMRLGTTPFHKVCE